MLQPHQHPYFSYIYLYTYIYIYLFLGVIYASIPFSTYNISTVGFGVSATELKTNGIRVNKWSQLSLMKCCVFSGGSLSHFILTDSNGFKTMAVTTSDTGVSPFLLTCNLLDQFRSISNQHIHRTSIIKTFWFRNIADNRPLKKKTQVELIKLTITRTFAHTGLLHQAYNIVRSSDTPIVIG